MPLMIFRAKNSEKIALNTDLITMICRDPAGYYAVRTAEGVIAFVTDDPESVVRRCFELARSTQTDPTSERPKRTAADREDDRGEGAM